MFLISAALLLAMQTAPDLAVVEVKEGPKGCVYRTEGRRLNEAQLEHRAKVWAGQRRRGEVHGARNTTYRCAGTAMSIMQNAGIEKVAFIGKPIRAGTVMLFVPRGTCRVVVNGEQMTLEVMRSQAVQWGRDKTEIQFQPDPNADYQCVDSALRIVNESSGIKLGFVGNEQLRGQ